MFFDYNIGVTGRMQARLEWVQANFGPRQDRWIQGRSEYLVDGDSLMVYSFKYDEDSVLFMFHTTSFPVQETDKGHGHTPCPCVRPSTISFLPLRLLL